MNFLEACKKIIQIDSTPKAGNREVALYCASLCRDAGLDVDLQEGDLNGHKQFNILARPKGSSRKDEIVFQTHLDTVEPGPMGAWTKTGNNAFKATIEGDRIYGLGVADVKLDFLCKLRALKDFGDKKMRNPFVLVGTYGEEIGMWGSQALVEGKMFHSRKAIIGEPSELQIVYANNGYMVVHFKIPFTSEEKKFNLEHDDHHNATTQEKLFYGKAVHSSTPHLGENAILKMVDYLAKMPEGISVLKVRGGSVVNTVPADAQIEIEPSKIFSVSVGQKLIKIVRELQRIERDFVGFENPEFSPGHPTMNIGVLRTQTDGLKLQVSFRMTPQIQEPQINTWIEKMKAIAQVTGSEFELERISKPAFTSAKSDLVVGAVEIAHALGLPEKPITKAGGTESSVYSQFGIECIVIGPGVSIGNSHTANEYNFLSQLEKASEFYSEAVKRFCI